MTLDKAVPVSEKDEKRDVGLSAKSPTASNPESDGEPEPRLPAVSATAVPPVSEDDVGADPFGPEDQFSDGGHEVVGNNNPEPAGGEEDVSDLGDYSFDDGADNEGDSDEHPFGGGDHEEHDSGDEEYPVRQEVQTRPRSGARAARNPQRQRQAAASVSGNDPRPTPASIGRLLWRKLVWVVLAVGLIGIFIVWKLMSDDGSSPKQVTPSGSTAVNSTVSPEGAVVILLTVQGQVVGSGVAQVYHPGMGLEVLRSPVSVALDGVDDSNQILANQLGVPIAYSSGSPGVSNQEIGAQLGQQMDANTKRIQEAPATAGPTSNVP